MIIDAHQHFWQYDPTKHAWINESMSVLKRDFLPDDLLKIYRACGVSGCVAVQAEQSEEETDFLLQLSDKYDFIKGIVGWIDLRDAALPERLDYYSRFAKLKGFRHLVQDEPDPGFLLEPDVQRGLGHLEKYKFTYDLLVYPHQMKSAIQTVKNFPQLNFVLDHIAKPEIEKGVIAGWDKSIQTLALENNVHCKISGIITEADWNNWQPSDFDPYLNLIIKAFGMDRIMFGSDWPVCLLAGSYPQVLDLVTQYSLNFSEENKRKLFYGNANAFYGLDVTLPY
jgi:L-fuconolactonase